MVLSLFYTCTLLGWTWHVVYGLDNTIPCLLGSQAQDVLKKVANYVAVTLYYIALLPSPFMFHYHLYSLVSWGCDFYWIMDLTQNSGFIIIMLSHKYLIFPIL